MIGFALAALVILCLPLFPDYLFLAVRALTLGFVLPALGVLLWLAYVPVKVTIGIPRIALLAIAFALGRMLQNSRIETAGSLQAGALMFTAFVLAAGPAVSRRMRRFLYACVVAAIWGSGIAWLGSLRYELNLVRVVLVFAGAYWATSLYVEWLRTGTSRLVRELENWRAEARKIVFRYSGTPEVRRKAAMEADLSTFAREIIAIGTRTMSSSERYRAVLAACAKRPGCESSWRIAYWVAVSQKDYPELARICSEGRHAGFAEFHLSSPPPRSAAAPVWQQWRLNDPTFARLQDELSKFDPLLEVSL